MVCACCSSVQRLAYLLEEEDGRSSASPYHDSHLQHLHTDRYSMIPQDTSPASTKLHDGSYYVPVRPEEQSR